jgi:hypothetical protein
VPTIGNDGTTPEIHLSYGGLPVDVVEKAAPTRPQAETVTSHRAIRKPFTYERMSSRELDPFLRPHQGNVKRLENLHSDRFRYNNPGLFLKPLEFRSNQRHIYSVKCAATLGCTQ